MHGNLFTGPTISRAGLLMVGLLTALLLGGCSAPSDVPTAAPTATPSGEEAAALEKMARSIIASECAACHAIRGVAFGKVGPDLSEIGARADAASIRESIVDPLAVIVETCPNGKPCPTKLDDEFGGMYLTYAETLTEEEINALVWYLTGLTGE